MSSRDVVASLVRSAARAAASQLGASALARVARSRLRELTLGRTAVAEDDLTRAVTRVAHVAAATVRCGQGRLRIDIGFDDGSQLLMAIAPDKITFAPGGAKEIAFAIEPATQAGDGRARDVVAAIAGEVARTLWRPALSGAPHSEHSAFVNVEADHMVVDLRDVPEVRWALQQSLRAAIIDAIQPRSLDVTLGRLDIPLALRLR